MKEISADKGYLGADNLMTTLRHGAIPYIPFKTNSVAQSGLGTEVATPDTNVSFLQLERGRVSSGLPQTIKR